jgi:hypothetical protein
MQIKAAPLNIGQLICKLPVEGVAEKSFQFNERRPELYKSVKWWRKTSIVSYSIIRGACNRPSGATRVIRHQYLTKWRSQMSGILKQALSIFKKGSCKDAIY